jgi:hypothetical protein
MGDNLPGFQAFKEEQAEFKEYKQTKKHPCEYKNQRTASKTKTRFEKDQEELKTVACNRQRAINKVFFITAAVVYDIGILIAVMAE